MLVILITFFSYKSILPDKEINNTEPKITINRLDIKKITSNTLPNKNVIETVPPKSLQTLPKSISATPQQDTKLSTKVNYSVPNSTQSLGVTITLQNNIVISVSTTHSYGGKSKKYQQNFENNYKSQVIGKNINNLNLSRVSGASLTTNAFNQAIRSFRNSL